MSDCDNRRPDGTEPARYAYCHEHDGVSMMRYLRRDKVTGAPVFRCMGCAGHIAIPFEPAQGRYG
jgi:hypothetical protein